MYQPKSLILGAAILAGLASTALAGDEVKKKKAKAASAQPVSAEQINALFDKALGSCCATGACAESGECDVAAPCKACDAGKCSPKKHVSPGEKLVKLVSSQPDALAHLLPELEDRFLAKDTVESQRNLMLELLAWCEADDSVACGEQLYKALPATFTEGHVLTFAAKGSKVFTKDLQKLAEEGSVVPCAFFATRSKKEDSKIVKRSIKHLIQTAQAESVDAKTARDQMLAAITLAKLGKGQFATDVHQRVHDAVVCALDEGALDAARSMALQAEFFKKAASKLGNPQGLGSMTSKMSYHVAARSKEVSTAEDVFQLIETITPM